MECGQFALVRMTSNFILDVRKSDSKCVCVCGGGGGGDKERGGVGEKKAGRQRGSRKECVKLHDGVGEGLI